MGKVILIGGSPMVGKSSVSLTIASKLKYPCISTDDIGEALQTVAPINPMQGKDFRDYYANTPIDRLIVDIQRYHKAMEPAIERLVEIHSSWGNSLLIEGWALYPKHIQQFKSNNISAVWLIACDGLLGSRLLGKPDFLDGVAARNYLSRSNWHNTMLLEQCKAVDAPFVFVQGNESADLLSTNILPFIP